MAAIVDTHLLGIQGRLYVGAAGTTPTVLLNDDQEVSIKIDNEMAKRATRGKPRKSARPSTQEISMDFTIAKDPANASYILLLAAAQGQTGIAVKSLDKVGGTGVDADWYVESWEESQPEDDWDGVKATLAFTSDWRDMTVI